MIHWLPPVEWNEPFSHKNTGAWRNHAKVRKHATLVQRHAKSVLRPSAPLRLETAEYCIPRILTSLWLTPPNCTRTSTGHFTIPYAPWLILPVVIMDTCLSNDVMVYPPTMYTRNDSSKQVRSSNCTLRIQQVRMCARPYTKGGSKLAHGKFGDDFVVFFYRNCQYVSQPDPCCCQAWNC